MLWRHPFCSRLIVLLTPLPTHDYERDKKKRHAVLSSPFSGSISHSVVAAAIFFSIMFLFSFSVGIIRIANAIGQISSFFYGSMWGSASTGQLLFLPESRNGIANVGIHIGNGSSRECLGNDFVIRHWLLILRVYLRPLSDVPTDN